MPKCDFNKVAMQIYPENLFLRTPLGGCFWIENFETIVYV